MNHAFLDKIQHSRKETHPRTSLEAHITKHWLNRVYEELKTAEDTLAQLGSTVCVFGSARLTEQSPYYQDAFSIAQGISEQGIHVLTGGGPSIMQAANHGAQQGAGHSVGLNIELPEEQIPNPYQTMQLHFKYFFTRKVAFVRYAHAYIFMPGGFGTLDELFEVLVLRQTQKLPPAPIILYGHAFWSGLVTWIEDVLHREGLIAPSDIYMYHIMDTPAEVVALVQNTLLGTSTH